MLSRAVAVAGSIVLALNLGLFLVVLAFSNVVTAPMRVWPTVGVNVALVLFGIFSNNGRFRDRSIPFVFLIGGWFCMMVNSTMMLLI